MNVAKTKKCVFPARAGMNRLFRDSSYAPVRRVFPARAGINRLFRDSSYAPVPIPKFLF